MSLYSVWGPPQSGKTTAAIDLATALSLHGLSVCLISGEPYSELSARMGIRIEPSRSITAIGSSTDSLRHIVCPASELLFVLAAPCVYDAFGEGLSAEQEKALLRQAMSSFDVVLVDCASHGSRTLDAWALRLADRVLFLTGGSTASALWCGAFARAVDAVRDRIVPVCMETAPDFDYANLFRLEALTPKYRLPHIPDAAAVQAERKSLYSAGGRAGRSYAAGLDALCSLLTGISTAGGAGR